jgi:hypothetical protein
MSPQPRTGTVIYTGCKPENLEDPLNPPEGVHGPFTIAGQNRSSYTTFILFCRVEICKEIIKDHLHDKPEYFESFMMTIYCFDDPTQQEQVRLYSFSYLYVDLRRS